MTWHCAYGVEHTAIRNAFILKHLHQLLAHTFVAISVFLHNVVLLRKNSKKFVKSESL